MPIGEIFKYVDGALISFFCLSGLLFIILSLNLKTDKKAYFLVILFVALLMLFGGKLHPCQQDRTAEMDGYVEKADQIVAGQIPCDPFHPLLYPILSSGAGVLLHDTFAGARLVSTVFAGIFVLLTYLIGRQLFNEKVGLFALLAMILNYDVITNGLFTSSDMTFSALVLLAVFFCMRLNSRIKLSRVILLAFSFALAYFTRYLALSLIPMILFAFSFPSTATLNKTKVMFLAVFSIIVVLILLPHFYLTAHVFGTLFYNENWKNLALKIYGNGDFSYYKRIPFNGWAAVIFSSPFKIIILFFREVWDFIARGALWEIYGFGFLFLFSAYRMFFVLNQKRVIVLLFIFSYIVLVCLSFYARPRLLLPILPLSYLIVFSFIFNNLPGIFRFKNLKVKYSTLIFIGFILWSAINTARLLPGFVGNHPLKEIEAALILQQKHGADLSVIGTNTYLQHYVRYRYYFDGGIGSEFKNPQNYYRWLQLLISEKHADYLIVGRLSLWDRPEALLSIHEVPFFLKPVFENKDVVIYKTEIVSGRLK